MTFENRSMSTRLMGLSRICKPLLRLNLVFFVCILFAGPRGFAQAPDDDQTSNPSVPSNPSSPSQRSQPQSDDEGTDQGANQQAGQSSTGGDQSVQMGVSPAQPTDALQSGGTMSPAQIISILQAEPDVLENVRSLVAQQTGADPTTITDKVLFERIRESEPTRILATNELVSLGYSVNPEPQPSTGTNQSTSRRSSRSNRTATPTRAEPAPYDNPDNPQVQHQLNPYNSIPSLADIYSQFSETSTKLKRFGSDAFLTGTSDANQLPMDLPAGPDYVLGSGDTLTLNLWGGTSERLIRTIDRQGQVQLPEAGSIMVSGMTIEKAQVAIQKALDTQFHGEHVEISLGRLHTVRVYVVGDVQRPGAYDVSSLSTPLSALYAAGGPTSRGSLRILRQFRGQQLVRQFDLYDFLLKGVRSNDDHLEAGDTILVPPVGSQVSVEGMVRRPAIYELNGEQNLNQVLDLAGGALVSANLQQIHVERIEAHQSRTMFNVQLPENQEEANQKLASFLVKDGDDVRITQILPYNSQAVYLEGHVFHPGKYPYKEGMTLADLLHSYQDVMPEPADRGELVRLRPPDFRPETINFNLPDVLIGNDSIPLQPFDLVRIYGRYEVDSPTVSIAGEVVRPGNYPMSQGMTVASLVRMAGGFRRGAYRESAGLVSYSVQNGEKVVLSRTDVEIQKALDGDKAADVPLKPGDIVNIRQLSGWRDIGGSVTITGEVGHTGSYGIVDGERLSSVLKRAGGFQPDAYPYAAVLERVQVRELGEQARQQMIQRIESTPLEVKSSPLTQQGGGNSMEALQTQRDAILNTLRNRPASGRLVINISTDISRWENTAADIELRAGDTLFIPKRPSFVGVNGQVYNPIAISYSPGKKLGWYLRKGGGAMRSGNKKDIYVLRADGSVVPRGRGWFDNNFMDLRMRPGDTIFVPEKIVGGSQVWQTILGGAQVVSEAAIPLAVSGVL